MIYLKNIQHNFKKNLVVYYLILAGFLLRLIFSSFPGFHVDTDTFFAWSVRAYDLGLSKFYSKDVWTNYTPGMIYLFYLLGFLKSFFSISDSFFYFVLKLPSIFADLVLSYLVFVVLRRHVSGKLALYGLAFCLFNPVLIFNSAVWGAFDGLMTLFLFLSVYFLSKVTHNALHKSDRNNLILTSVFFGISLLLKPQAVALLPVFGIWILKNFSLKNILFLFLPAVLTVFLFSLPYFPKDPFFGFANLFIQMAQDYKGNSLFAYNLWGVFGFWIDDSTILGFLPYRSWALLILALFWVYFLVIFLRKKVLDVYIISTLAFLAFFFLPTRVHERYLFSAIPFLILISVYLRDRILIVATITLSLVHTINLYYVYIYYNEFYLKLPRVLYIPGFYESLENESKILSLISTLIFMLIIITIARRVQITGNK